ncbi:MAG: DUF4159 domain-containing protein [Verrucomicrobia bacterium]|nr:DUF4159 domain-containing protein [Verrucomicrobiota bacterium]
MKPHVWVARLVYGAMVAGTCVRAGENDWFVPLGPPPQAAPRRISGGEGMPPLPLPATPLRRSERKREPSGPKMIAKVIWGESADFKYDNGLTGQVSDWNQCPGDLQQVVRKAGAALGTSYSTDVMSLSSFPGDPVRTPVLFLSGSRTIKFDKKTRELLHDYVVRGGMIIADNVAGSPYFYASMKKAMEEAFPELTFRELPTDHPIYHLLTDVDEVKYPRNLDSNKPLLEGMYVYSRVGVLLSKYGLGCGWDDHEVPMLKQAVYYDVPSATKIGVNLIAYAAGYANVGRESAKPELFGTLDEKRPTDEFVFAQIKHEGAWNVHSGGAASLLRRLRQNSAVRVSLKRVPVLPGKDDLSGFGFLYLSGLDEFHFDAAAVAAIRAHLNRGGTLLVNNGLGLKTFDAAARRELSHILPDSALTPLPPNHPLYSTVFKISEAQYTPAVVKSKPSLKTPYLEGISVGGDLRVIYSPLDLEVGWTGLDHPLAKGFEPDSAMQLGVNIVVYAMTH